MHVPIHAAGTRRDPGSAHALTAESSKELKTTTGRSRDDASRGGWSSRARVWRSCVALLCAAWPALAPAEVAVDPLEAVALPVEGSAHWVWVNDIVFNHMADGKAFLVDGDKARMLGMLSTGYGFNGVVTPRGGEFIYSPEIYFSRGTRGTRTDVLTIYDRRRLAPVAEVPLPPKRTSSVPMINNAGLSDDERFVFIYNFTPAQSVTVVDTRTRAVASEIETAGCALVYPTGPRGFFSLCNDGTALSVRLDEQGGLRSKAHSSRLFDPVADPVTEKAVRYGQMWLFATFSGDIVPVDGSGELPSVSERWSLLQASDRAAQWMPGGIQHLALHASSRRLYSLMHRGGEDSHKDPGNQVWVYDLASRKRTQVITLQEIATSIAVSSDAAPLMYTVFVGAPQVDVYDARSGAFLRSVKEIGFSPVTLVAH